jgi:hypothetical protein
MPSPEIFHRPRVVFSPDDKTNDLQNAQIESANKHQKQDIPIQFRELKEGDAEQMMKQLEEHTSKVEKVLKRRMEKIEDSSGIEKVLKRRIEKIEDREII